MTNTQQDRLKEVITNCEKTDGFGAQFQIILTTAIYAELNNKEFFYTPFKIMEHNYNNDPNFIQKKEQLINFIGNFETIDEAIKKNYKIQTANYLAFFDANTIACANSNALKKIKKIFRENKDANNYFDTAKLNIALHLRRPNPHDIWSYGTDVPDDIYIRVIDKLRVIYASKTPLFHLYSQGDIQNFGKFNSPDIILHLNESIEDTFTSMVLADVLVTGKSSFSYTAGYLSDGTIYHISYAHAPLPHWIPVDDLLKE
ncbi:MAG TPA: hypothetical protein VHO47_05695 [Candidatus Babeliales bacterium]|nr:hypothetical protein [Candidatus Babeliales bacterium]